MTYQEAESFLFTELQSFQEKGKIAFKSNLDNALALSELLDHPHQQYKTVHVAGTNGKGSVTHIIAAGLQANGYNVGVYTSPHYKTYRERIKINGLLISEAEVAKFVTAYKADIERIKPSFFEITCAMAFHHFAKQEVDIAVIEVGLGGRLDSTNIIHPVISVITNISYDHQAILGDTLDKIASEKAGIIKPNIPIVIGENQEEIRHVFTSKAEESGSKIYFAEDLSTMIETQTDSTHKYAFHPGFDLDWKVQFRGKHYGHFQLKNLRTGLYTLALLNQQFNLDANKVSEGIQNLQRITHYIGRWDVRSENPLVIFDSAHNVAGVEYLVNQILSIKYDTLRIVWGTTKEKDVKQILSLLPKNAEYYFCQADNGRALDAEELRIQANTMGLSGFAYPSVMVAHRIAITEANPNDLIIVAGSVFVIAELV